MSEIVVVGAGFAGLYSALLLARRGHSVALLEKDAEPPPEGAEACFADWRRRGLAQARQPHLLLNRAARVLQEETPEVLSAFADAGANLLTAMGERVRPAERERLFLTCGRRLPLEAVLRRRVAAEPGVELRTAAEVSSLLLNGAMVRGVQLDDGFRISAELVVDASGRWSKSAAWLGAHGLRVDPEQRHDCDFAYLTTWYRRRGPDFPPGPTPRRAISPFANFMCFPADGTVFGATVVLSLQDPLKGKCRTPEAFARVFSTIPGFDAWLDEADPIGETEVTARIENCWRSLLRDGRPAVGGLVLLGDSAVHTNPTLGRGISLALLQAAKLPRLLETLPAGSPELVDEFERWRADELAVWYVSQAAADAQRLAQMRLALAGETPPDPVDQRSRFAAAVGIAATRDDYVAERAQQLFHMLITPGELAADPRVEAAAGQILDSGVELRTPTPGPGRGEFEAALHS